MFGKAALQAAVAPVRPAGVGAARRRPRGAGAGSRPLRPADRGHDPLQPEIYIRLEHLLYTGFFVVVAVYFWIMMERRMNDYSKPAGVLAFIWRPILTTGTGSIFGFLVARAAYDTAVLAPMFIMLSFAYGLALSLLVLLAAHALERPPEFGDAVLERLRNLLGVFVAAALYSCLFTISPIFLSPSVTASRAFILRDGGFTLPCSGWARCSSAASRPADYFIESSPARLARAYWLLPRA